MRNATNLADWSRFWDNFNYEIYIKFLKIKNEK